MNIKLDKYLVSALAITGAYTNSNAEVIYTDVNPDLNLQDTVFGIDLDSNGVFDFSFNHTSGSFLYGIADLGLSNQIIWPQTIYSTLSGNCFISSSKIISSNLSSFTSNYGWINPNTKPGNLRPQYYTSYVFSSEGYIGVKFDISGNNHYGWIRARSSNLDYSSGMGASFLRGITIYDYAYESCPNAPITVGATSGFGPCDSLVNNVISVYDTLTGCDSIPFYLGGFISNNYTYYDTISVDSVLITTYSVNYSSVETVIDTTIGMNDSIFINGTMYSNVGSYSTNYTNSNGCDSLVTVNISSNYVVLNNVLSDCDTVLFGGNFYTSDIILYDTINQDSVIITEIFVNQSSDDVIIDTTINLNDSIIIGNTTLSGWGIYQIPLTNSNGCDSLVTVNISIINGIKTEQTQIFASPNPTKNLVNLSGLELFKNGVITLFNSVGKIEREIKVTSNKMFLDVSTLTNGVYFINIKNKEVSKSIKLIVTD